MIMATTLLLGGFGYYFMMKHSNVKDARVSPISSTIDEKKGKDHKIPFKILVSPSLNTIDKYEKISNNEITSHNIPDNTQHIQTTAPIEVVEDIPILDEKTFTPMLQTQKKNKKKKVVIHINETTSISAYKDVEKRFNQSHDIDDSLFLARGYYAKGDYKKAAYWALQTNKLNNKIDESWIIFIKSKVALGEKNEAIHILQSYIRKSNSYKARKLLDKLQN